MTTLTHTESPQDTDRDRHTSRKLPSGAITGIAAVAGAAVLLSGPAVPAVFAGLNLGNHNETLLVPPRRPAPKLRREAITGIAAVAGAAVLLSGPAVPAVFAGMNLGNHNETLLVPPPRPVAKRRRRAVAAVSICLGLATVGLGAGPLGSDAGAVELAKPGNYGSGSGGGGTT